MTTIACGPDRARGGWGWGSKEYPRTRQGGHYTIGEDTACAQFTYASGAFKQTWSLCRYHLSQPPQPGTDRPSTHSCVWGYGVRGTRGGRPSTIQRPAQAPCLCCALHVVIATCEDSSQQDMLAPKGGDCLCIFQLCQPRVNASLVAGGWGVKVIRGEAGKRWTTGDPILGKRICLERLLFCLSLVNTRFGPQKSTFRGKTVFDQCFRDQFYEFLIVAKCTSTSSTNEAEVRPGERSIS